MRKVIVPVVLALLMLVACTKAKGKSGATCTGKSDCADGLNCYIIGIQFTCLTPEEGAAACKVSPGCKSGGKCTATDNATQASDPQYYMGGCK
jgi:hypothetical protein